MEFETTVPVTATPEALWRAVVDVGDWSRWTASILQVEWVTDTELKEAAQVRVKQPGLPALVWTVTDWEPGRSFAWQTKTPGVRTVGRHVVSVAGSGHSVLTLGLEQSGPMAPVVGALTGKRTRRYIQMEADGLKRRAESSG